MPLVDWNGWEACGKCEDISGKLILPDRWAAFGRLVEKIDGHDYQQIVDTLKKTDTSSRPRVVLCRTIKGKGVDFMENNLEWHYRPVRGEDKIKACQ